MNLDAMRKKLGKALDPQILPIKTGVRAGGGKLDEPVLRYGIILPLPPGNGNGGGGKGKLP